MRFRDTDLALVVRAPAKVNLFLEVLGKRPDGYHEIATCMVAVRLFDRLTLRSADEWTLSSNRADLSTGPDNLIAKAAQLLREHTGCDRGASVHLEKRIPVAAGMAGGSTDAAAALAGLNRLWELGLPDRTLAQLSAKIGSDIPFFFHTPAAWCTGRGEVVRPLRMKRRLDFVVVAPPVGLSTAEVYRGVIPPEKSVLGEELVTMLEQGNVAELGKLLHNRLQESAERLSPVVGRTLTRIRDQRPAGALMSGSGSSLFALCSDRKQAVAIANNLRASAEGERIYVVQSCSEQPPLS